MSNKKPSTVFKVSIAFNELDVCSKYLANIMGEDFTGVILNCEIPMVDIETIETIFVTSYFGITEKGYTDLIKKELVLGGEFVELIKAKLYDMQCSKTYDIANYSNKELLGVAEKVKGDKGSVLFKSVDKEISKRLKERSQQLESSVNKPPHYNKGRFETIDVIEDWKLNFNLGNAVKYISRCNHKNNKEEDLKKAIYYIQREIKTGKFK